MGEQLTTIEREAVQVRQELHDVMGATAIDTVFAELHTPEQPALFWDDIDEVKKYVFQIPGQTALDIEEV